MQDEATTGFDGPALEHFHVFGAIRKLDTLGRRDHFELHQEVGKFDILCRLIDDDAHRTFGRMRTDIDYGACETLITHGWHCDQHLPIKITSAGCCALLHRFT